MATIRRTEVRPTGGLVSTEGSECQVPKRPETEHIDELVVEQAVRDGKV
jgi:hypothetical protein